MIKRIEVQVNEIDFAILSYSHSLGLATLILNTKLSHIEYAPGIYMSNRDLM